MALSREEEAQVDLIVASIDLSGWAILANGMTSLLTQVAQESGREALITAGIADDTQADLFNVVGEDAAAFAAARGAELVGMRYDAEGNLIENPDAEWAITDGTRAFIRGLVSDAIENGWSSKQLSDAVEESYSFSETRAEMIGRTEIARAQEQGALAAWKKSGVVDRVEWVLGSEHDADVPAGDECDDNDGVVVAIGEAFPSGDEAPPAHPNCVCALMPVVSESGEDEEG